MNQKLLSNKRSEMKMKEIEELSKATQMKIKAEGEKNATRIRTQSEKEALLVLAEAERDAAIFKAQGERNATEILADAEAYRNKVIAESEALRFTAAYLQKHWQENVVPNGFYFGEKIPTYMASFPETENY